ncbi:hypothetical protein [Nannocystis pusilla]|uniref:hypothetical protein n=1 Tax=Nannocystis pusilla TaxID=889268 RepID=UPI003B81FA1A
MSEQSLRLHDARDDFWIGAGAIFAGAAHLAYGTGYSRAAAKVQVAPSLGPGYAGLGLAGRF